MAKLYHPADANIPKYGKADFVDIWRNAVHYLRENPINLGSGIQVRSLTLQFFSADPEAMLYQLTCTPDGFEHSFVPWPDMAQQEQQVAVEDAVLVQGDPPGFEQSQVDIDQNTKQLQEMAEQNQAALEELHSRVETSFPAAETN